MASKLLPGYKGLGGSSKRVLDTRTGETLSRRQYAQRVKRSSLLTNEQLAKINKKSDPKSQILRPTKGRTSALKLAPAISEDVANARIEEQERISREKSREKQQKKVDHKIELAKGKRVKVKKITARLLEPGKLGRRLGFNDYDDYLSLFKQAKATKKIFAYGMGVEGVDARSGLIVTPTLWTLRSFDKPISEREFDEKVTDFLTSRSYIVFTNFWMHLAFNIAFAREKAKNAPRKRKQQKRKR